MIGSIFFFAFLMVPSFEGRTALIAMTKELLHVITTSKVHSCEKPILQAVQTALANDKKNELYTDEYYFPNDVMLFRCQCSGTCSSLGHKCQVDVKAKKLIPILVFTNGIETKVRSETISVTEHVSCKCG